ncbi:MAG: hypothetical protein KAT70_08960, partial [Thermoplasmata archaeon]|nr:hypothetical protein [Thermoplasmata archaeon]
MTLWSHAAILFVVVTLASAHIIPLLQSSPDLRETEPSPQILEIYSASGIGWEGDNRITDEIHRS